MRPIIPLPQLDISIDGDEIAAKDIDTLYDVRVSSALSAPTLCEVTFLNPAGPLGTAAASPIGAGLQIKVRGSDTPLFAGEITALEYGYETSGATKLRVRGYDLLHRLRKRQPVRAHVQVTVGDLARELVADLGMDVKVDDAGPLWRRLIQYRQSDLDLLIDVAARCGLYLAVREGALHLLSLDGIGDPVPLELGDTLLEGRIELNADSTCRSVAATTWDASRIQHYLGRAGAPRSGRDVAADAPPGQVGGSGERNLANRTAQGDRHAEAIAQAELDCRTMSEVTVWGRAEGDPALMAGARVEISGVSDRLAGRYVLTSVIHTIDARGSFVSEFSSAPPSPPSTAESGLVGTLGIVCNIADPEKLGRVQVSLPAFAGTESDWMGVMAAGAGAGKGFVSLPAVGDQVLVLAQGDDLAQGVVLGGLHGVMAPPDWGLDGDKVRRFGIFTPGGHVLQFDDGRGTMRLQDRSGNYLRFAPDKVTLHSAVDLEIEAPGKAVVIRGDTIDFERA